MNNTQKHYCIKIKSNFLKVRTDNAYVRANIEDFGFAPMFEEEKNRIEGWGKSVKVKHDSFIGKWIKNQVEGIYKAEKDKEDSTYIKELLEEGYAFDQEGKLIENPATTNDINVQLCVMKSGKYSGLLFLNVGAAMELYDYDTLYECVPGSLKELEKANAIYKKRFKE